MRKQKELGFKSNFDYLQMYFDILYDKVCIYAIKNMKYIISEGETWLSSEDSREFFSSELRIKKPEDVIIRLKDLKKAYISKQHLFELKIKSSLIPLQLEDIAKKAKLNKFEKDVIALCLAVATEVRFQRLNDKLHFFSSDKVWEIKDYLNILTDSLEEKIRARCYLSANGTLYRMGLVLINYSNHNIVTEDGFLTTEISLPRRVSNAIYGEKEPDDMILSFTDIITPSVSLDKVVIDEEAKREVINLVEKREIFMNRRRKWGLSEIFPYGTGTIMLFSGKPGTGKTMLAHALAKHAGVKLLQVNVPKLMDADSSFEECFKLILREAGLQDAILFFDEADELFCDRSINMQMPIILREFEKFDGIAILATNRKQILDEALDRRILYKLDFEVPGPDMREKIWREHLPPQLPLANDVNLSELAEKYEFAGGYIKNAVLLAVQKAVARTGKKAKISQADLRWAAKTQRESQLEKYTDKITPKIKLDEIILPLNLKNTITRIIREYINRNKVYATWGFKSTIHYGRAITALFYGKPGTGKTMAAEAIAFELGLNLYPVKIPAVISPYIGETSRNLREIFKSAVDAEAVLLFDEADALFNARLESSSYHAVYINQEIDTLLQEIERFEGIVILTTNMPERIDKAFMRRIRHKLNFPVPSPEARAKIWKNHFPKDAPLAKNIDFSELGKFELTGGTIRNIAIKAAFEAACNENKTITYGIIEKFIREELDFQAENKKVIGFSDVA